MTPFLLSLHLLEKILSSPPPFAFFHLINAGVSIDSRYYLRNVATRWILKFYAFLEEAFKRSSLLSSLSFLSLSPRVMPGFGRDNVGSQANSLIQISINISVVE